MPSENQLTDRLKEVARIAREVMLRDGYHVPIVIAENEEQSVIVQIDALGGTNQQRLYQLFVVGLILAESGDISVLQQAFLITEAWMSFLRRGDSSQPATADDAKRKEVLMITGLNVEAQRAEVIVYESKRDQKGRLRDLQEMFPDKSEFEAESPLLSAFVRGFFTGLK